MPTKIEWCRNPDGTPGETWNIVTGCTRVSAGCKHCWATRMAPRLRGRYGYPDDEPFRVTFHEDRLQQPHGWTKPRTVFVCSMGDLFHPDVRGAWYDRIFNVVEQTQRHTYILLTKRPERINGVVRSWCAHRQALSYNFDPVRWPENIRLGVSVENQATADERIPLLLQTPAAVRWVSVEPMLAPVDLCRGGWSFLSPLLPPPGNRGGWKCGLDWVVCGCESGPGARSFDLDWARSLRDQCVEAGVPYFLKQATVDGRLVKMPELDGRVWDQMPRRAT